VAQAHGLGLEGHIARQFSRELGLRHDLILTMEVGHRRQIINLAPDLSGRVMLFDHWLGGKCIPDPYKKPPQVHEEVFDLIEAAADAWAGKLAASGSGGSHG
jgi:protein-tyrosine phosphatase